MKRNHLTKGIILTLITLLTLSTSYTQAFATTISPTVKSFVVKKDDIIFEEIKYKNDSNKTENITISVSSYDTKKEENLTDKPFITVKDTKFTIKPKKEIVIPYIIAIPTETPAGTYFNVVYIEKKEKDDKSGNVTVVQSNGILFSFHVEDSTTSLNQIFYNQSDIKLVVKNKGLPYYIPTQFEYVYTNNSNFVFKPQGEIRIIDSKGNQIMERFETNKDIKAVYPGETITQSFEVNMWKDIQSILSSKTIVSKTYSDIDQTPVLNKVDVSVIYQIGVILGVIAIIVLATIILIISTIIRAIKSKKKKESEK